MEPRLLTATIVTGLFAAYMLINLAAFWRQLEEMRDKSEKQDRLKGRYSGYRGLGGLTALLGHGRYRKKSMR